MYYFKILSFFTAAVLIVSVSYRYYRYGEVQIKSLLISACLLRLAAAIYPCLHDWDERYHALVAKNMLVNPLMPRLYPVDYLPYNYQNWICNYIWLHKQPFALWSMACSIKMFGANELAVRAPSVILSTIAVYLTYLIGKWMFSSKIGLIAAVFHALNGFIIELTGGAVPSDHIDVSYLFWIELAMLFSVYSSYKLAEGSGKRTQFAFLIGVILGICILCKWLPCLIIVPVYAILHWKQSKTLLHSALLLLTGLLVAAPWQVYAAFTFPQEYWYEMNFNSRHLYEVIEEQGHSMLYHFDLARIIWNELVYLPFFWLLYKGVKKSTQPLLALTTWILLPYLFFTLAATKMPAYTLFCGPAIFITQALFLESLDEIRFKSIKVVLTAAFLLLASRYCAERVKPFKSYPKAEALRFKIEKLRATYQNPKTALFNVQSKVELMFYTDFIAYGHFPSDQDIQTLSAAGYDIIVLDTPDMPDDLRANKLLKLSPDKL